MVMAYGAMNIRRYDYGLQSYGHNLKLQQHNNLRAIKYGDEELLRGGPQECQ